MNLNVIALIEFDLKCEMNINFIQFTSILFLFTCKGKEIESKLLFSEISGVKQAMFVRLLV